MSLLEKELESQFYQTVKLAEGIYAFIDAYDRKAGCNSGLIDLGDRVLVVDTFYNPDAAKELRKAAERLSNGRAITVVNTHGHVDHVTGNQYFSDCSIISSEICRSFMSETIPEMIKEVSETPVSDIAAMRSNLETETNELKKLALINEFRYFDYLSRDQLVSTPPDIAFMDKLIIHGTTRTAELHTFELGHSQGDVILFIPDESILFCGDLLFAEAHPWLGSGDRSKMKEIGSLMIGFGAKYIVPGHGPVAGNKNVEEFADYIDHVQKVASEAVVSHLTAEDALDKVLIPPYDKWEGKIRALNNLRFLIKTLSENNK